MCPADVSNPGSFEDVVELLIPELQKRGIYWSDYAAPGGTARENIHNKPGKRLLAPEHPGAKLRWNAPRVKADVQKAREETVSEPKIEQIKGIDVASTTVAMTEVSA
jgi:hypothetical protein